METGESLPPKLFVIHLSQCLIWRSQVIESSKWQQKDQCSVTFEHQMESHMCHLQLWQCRMFHEVLHRDRLSWSSTGNHNKLSAGRYRKMPKRNGNSFTRQEKIPTAAWRKGPETEVWTRQNQNQTPTWISFILLAKENLKAALQISEYV